MNLLIMALALGPSAAAAAQAKMAAVAPAAPVTIGAQPLAPAAPATPPGLLLSVADAYRTTLVALAAPYT
ncbi:MAG: hypothetical protein HY553_20370, partial [Elusimicrobia bacterium]|nr:hypothetical protein [Elusimicrobiota bacterium]